jgi:hypothetical protein
LSGFKIDRNAIKRMTQEIEREFARNPVRVPLETSSPGSGAPATARWSAVGTAAACILDWLYGRSDSSSTFVSMAQFGADCASHPLLQLIQENGVIAVGSLAADDLVNKLDGWGDAEVQFMLTDAGRHAAALQIEQRRNRLSRTVASREAVLAWGYSMRPAGGLDVRAIDETPYGWFAAEQLAIEEVGAAVEYLVGVGLLEGHPEAFTLTEKGVKCVEQYGGVVEYQKRSDPAGVSVVFTGDNNGQLAIGNRDVQQNLSQDNDAKVLGIYARALRELAGLLPEGEGEELTEVASSLEREAGKDQRDQGWVKSLIERAKGLLGSTTELKNLAEVTRLGLDVYNSAHSG